MEIKSIQYSTPRNALTTERHGKLLYTVPCLVLITSSQVSVIVPAALSSCAVRGRVKQYTGPTFNATRTHPNTPFWCSTWIQVLADAVIVGTVPHNRHDSDSGIGFRVILPRASQQLMAKLHCDINVREDSRVVPASERRTKRTTISSGVLRAAARAKSPQLGPKGNLSFGRIRRSSMAFSIVFLAQLVQLVGNFCRDAFNRIVQRIVTNQIQPGERLKVPSAKKTDLSKRTIFLLVMASAPTLWIV